jgi:hypothetical protein
LPRSTSFSSSLDVRGATSVDESGGPTRPSEGGNDNDHLVRRRSMANLGIVGPPEGDSSLRGDGNRVRFATPSPATQQSHHVDPSSAPSRNPGESQQSQQRGAPAVTNGRHASYSAYSSSPENELTMAMRNMKVDNSSMQQQQQPPQQPYPYYYPQSGGYPVEYGASPVSDPAFDMYRRDSNSYAAPASSVPYSSTSTAPSGGGRSSPTTLRRSQSAWGVGAEYGAAPTPVMRPASYSYQPQPQPNQGSVLIPAAYATSPYGGPMELASPEMSPAIFRAPGQQQQMLVARRPGWVPAAPLPPPGYRSASMDFGVPAWPFAQPNYAPLQTGLRYDDRARAVRSPLLDEFRTNRHRRWELQVSFYLLSHYPTIYLTCWLVAIRICVATL